MSETTPQILSECKVTYFMGKILAKAGVLSLRSDGLTFVPTALDRAVGAIDIPIPLGDIQAFFYNDTMQKTLQIKTASQTHRFIGSGINEIHENLILLKRESQAAGKAQISSVPSLSESMVSSQCFTCSKPIDKKFKYCPFCRTQLKNLCSNCREQIEESWIACPFCNTELKKT